MERQQGALKRRDLLPAFGLWLVSLGVYRLTLSPSLSYASPDGNELATVPYVLGLAHSPGYPLFTWLGKAFTLLPLGDIAHRMNLMSAVLGASTLAMLYLILIQVLPDAMAPRPTRRIGSAAACLLLAFSPTFWSQAVIAEVYLPNLALITSTVLFLLRWERTGRDRDFFLFALTFGLSLGTHISNLGFACGFALFILLTSPQVLRRLRWWASGFGGFLLGAAQFIWLPIRATTLSDRLMLARAPVDLKGIYNYTLGAFPQLKFAFPLGELPVRIVVYLDLLREEFGLLALLLGVIGLASLLLRSTRYFYLFVGMYVIHIWFFVQYRAFDLEVFFLPAHLLWSIFLAYGLIEVTAGLQMLLIWVLDLRDPRASVLVVSLLALVIPCHQLVSQWQSNDKSQDVAINDFYANVWELLPEGSTLLTQGGVFGYDAFYWQLAYQTRLDVLLPMLPPIENGKEAIGVRSVYSTTPSDSLQRNRGLTPVKLEQIGAGSWQIPVLLGNPGADPSLLSRNRLTLYQLSESPPDLLVADIGTAMPVDVDLGGVRLVGLDLDSAPIESGSCLSIKLFWEVQQQHRYVISLFLSGVLLETHEIGLGNLMHYQTLDLPSQGGIIQEAYRIVIPSSLPEGSQLLEVSLNNSPERHRLSVIQVIDNEETMERWLRIAGK